jgi:hypothetical protein
MAKLVTTVRKIVGVDHCALGLADGMDPEGHEFDAFVCGAHLVRTAHRNLASIASDVAGLAPILLPDVDRALQDVGELLAGVRMQRPLHPCGELDVGRNDFESICGLEHVARQVVENRCSHRQQVIGVSSAPMGDYWNTALTVLTVLETCEEQGVNTDSILRRAGLDRATVEDPEGRCRSTRCATSGRRR